MKGEEQIIELLRQTLQGQEAIQQDIAGMRQDITGMQRDITGMQRDITGMQRNITGMKEDITEIKGEIVEIKQRLGKVETNQQAHQQILRTLATGQKSHQESLENSLVLVDSITRLQRDHGRRLDRLEAPSAPDLAA